MDRQFEETFGSWTQAIGPVISTVKVHHSLPWTKNFAKNLDLIGNELQRI
ncbi:hypothetical protein ACQJ0Y_02845 [Peribacillus simplex]